MGKSLPVIAVVLAVVALAMAGISFRMLPAPSTGEAPDQAALVERLRKLERQHDELQKDYAELLERTGGGTTAADPMTATADGTNGTAAFRLREGIERFYISDINNPAASATAQSMVSTVTTAKTLVTAAMPMKLSLAAGNIRMGISGSHGPRTKTMKIAHPVMGRFSPASTS